MVTNKDYWIKDISLAQTGKRRVLETLRDMPGLMEIEKEWRGKKPLKKARIAGCVIVSYETAAFIWLLKKLGAKLRWCSDNRFASLDDACAFIASLNIPIFAKSGMTKREYFESFKKSTEFRDQKGKFIGPNLIVDDGCDITRYLHKNFPSIYKNVFGTCEQTTCGVNAHYKLKASKKLKTIVIDINDSVTKSKFDNIYGSRESLIKGLQSSINMQLGGKTIIIFGYGEVGKGCSMALAGLGAHLKIVEIDPIMAVQAHMHGYEVVSKREACQIGDIFITTTGCNWTINKKDLLSMKNGAILANMGHGDMEIDTKYLNEKIIKRRNINKNLDEYILPNKKSVFLLARGSLLNLVAADGHPPRVMSITFSNHILALIELLKNHKNYKKGEIYRLPRILDEEAARLNFPEMKNKLTRLTKEQAQYLGVNINGPFKRNDYRY